MLSHTLYSFTIYANAPIELLRIASTFPTSPKAYVLSIENGFMQLSMVSSNSLHLTCVARFNAFFQSSALLYSWFGGERKELVKMNKSSLIQGNVPTCLLIVDQGLDA